MFESIDRARVQDLMRGGAQIVEVLEAAQYRAAHLPGAVHIPAWALTAPRAATLDRNHPVVVYCFDTQ